MRRSLLCRAPLYIPVQTQLIKPSEGWRVSAPLVQIEYWHWGLLLDPNSQIMDNPPGQSSLPAKRKVGRPNDRIWDHFEKGIKRPGSCRHPGKCTYCHVVIEDGRPENLYKHIVKCDSVPAQVRLEYTELQAKRLEAQRALSLTKKPKLSAEFVPVGEVSLAGSPGTVRPPKMPGSSQPRRMADKSVHATNVSLLRMLITSSQPFALIKNPYFAAFVRALCPEYSLPGMPLALVNGLVMRQVNADAPGLPSITCWLSEDAASEDKCLRGLSVV